MTGRARLEPSDPETRAAGLVDAVFTFSVETWADAQRRGMARPPDRLLEALLHSPAVGGLVVANPYRSAPVRWVRRRSGPAEPAFPEDRRHTLVSPLRLRRRDPVAVPALERVYARYDRRLEAAARRLGLRSPIVLTVHPFVAAFAPLAWARSVTYYARDDWATFPPHRRWWPAYEQAYARIRARRRRVCAVSRTLLERVAPTGPAAVVPNGVRPEEWHAPGAPSAWFAALPRPRLLYTGTLDDRIDTDAVAELARRFPTGSVALVGPVADEAHCAPLRSLPNVHLLGSRPRAELPAVTLAADACVVPHRRTPLTAAMSPLKLYEYLAGGRPVAATDTEPMRGISERVLLVGPEQRFADAAAAALRLGPAPEAERLAFVEANSWARRHETIMDVALA